MKIPKNIKIGWRNFKIVKVKNLKDEDKTSLLGRIDYNKNTIELENNGILHEFQKVVFLHEFVHGVFNALGKNALNEDEQLVDGMAEILYGVIKENKLMDK